MYGLSNNVQNHSTLQGKLIHTGVIITGSLIERREYTYDWVTQVKKGGASPPEKGALKGQCHEIFEFRFFHQITLSCPMRGSLGQLGFY